MFSIARMFSGCKFNGAHYTYVPPTDELIRDDVIKLVMTLRTKRGKRKRAKKETCHADDDDYCTWKDCPQNRDNEPAKSGRHCPLDLERIHAEDE